MIQFRVSNKDELLTLIISKLEEQGEGKKGYVAEKLREMIKTYYMLSELVDGDGLKDPVETGEKIKEIVRSYQALTQLAGETDPYKIIAKLAQRSSPSPSPAPATPTGQEEPPPPPKKRKRIDPSKFNFGID